MNLIGHFGRIDSKYFLLVLKHSKSDVKVHQTSKENFAHIHYILKIIEIVL